MVIKGKIQELLDLVRECEYNRITNNCEGCLFKSMFDEDLPCMGIDTEIELEVIEDGNLQTDIHEVLE